LNFSQFMAKHHCCAVELLNHQLWRLITYTTYATLSCCKQKVVAYNLPCGQN
jgi:hypothetical protein